MKTLPSLSLALLSAGVLLACSGCADDEPHSSQPGPAQTRKYAADKVDRDDDDARSHPPRLGMTKEKIRDLYGKPSNEETTPQGETWFYDPNGVHGLDFVPYYGLEHQLTRKRRGGTIIFGPDGRVVDFNWKSE